MQPEDQRTEPRYTIVPRTLIFLTRDDRLLLLKGAPHKRLWADQYNGLGGHVERGETPFAAARREVREEAGLEVEELELRAIVHVTLPDPPGVMLFVFVGEAPQGEPRASEEGEPLWVEQNALKTLPLVEDLPLLLPHVLSPGPMIFGDYRVTEDGLEVHFEREPAQAGG